MRRMYMTLWIAFLAEAWRCVRVFFEVMQSMLEFGPDG